MKMETLIIDDDKIICFLHKKLCDRCEMPNRIFTQPEAALDYLRTPHSMDKEFLLLLDINMPRLSGWDVLDELRRTGLDSRTEVIMVTSSIDEADLQRSREYPVVCGFVSKPLSLEKLKAIRNRESFLKLP